jgi:hypothetical protein
VVVVTVVVVVVVVAIVAVVVPQHLRRNKGERGYSSLLIHDLGTRWG